MKNPLKPIIVVTKRVKAALTKSEAPAPVVKTNPKPKRRKTLDKPLSKAERARRETVKARAALDVLTVAYPGAFDKTHRPLAIGIHHQLLTEKAAGNLDLSSVPLRLGVRHWTQSRPYIAQLVKGGPRYNLKGEAEGEVTQEQSQEAEALLNRIMNRIANKEEKKAKKLAKLAKSTQPA